MLGLRDEGYAEITKESDRLVDSAAAQMPQVFLSQCAMCIAAQSSLAYSMPQAISGSATKRLDGSES